MKKNKFINNNNKDAKQKLEMTEYKPPSLDNISHDLLAMILSNLPSQELLKIRAVAKVLLLVVNTDRRLTESIDEWTQHTITGTAFDKVKAYAKTKQTIEASKNGILVGNIKIGIFANTPREIFREAIKKGDISTVSILLHRNEVGINDSLGDYTPWIACSIYSAITPIYLAALRGHFELVRFLLSHNADIESEIMYTMGFEGVPVTSTQQVLHEQQTKDNIKALLNLAAAEKQLAKNNFECAISYFKKAFANDYKTSQEYVNTVLEKKQGFQLIYSDALLSNIEKNIKDIMQYQPTESSCTII